MKQEEGKTGSEFSKQSFWWLLTPPAGKQSGGAGIDLPLPPLCFNFTRHKKAQMCFTTSNPWSSKGANNNS